MLNTLHLFAGAGGGLLADLILGHNPIGAVEWDSYCCGILRQHAADGWFPDLHVWEGDVRLFDPSKYAGRVDCIHAGFPCQDLSVAGKQSGLGEGTRSGLYREVLRIARMVRPRYLYLENVAAILSGGLEHVLADLAAIGYDCRWTCLRASDCGAPHQRDRWWLLADSGRGRFSKPQKWEIQQPRRSEVVSAGEVVANAPSQRCGEAGSDSERSEERTTGCCDPLADACAIHAQREQSKSLDSEGWPRQNARQTGSCRNGVKWWPTEPDVGRVANGVAFRVDRLKAIGNGQVPLQAAVAWKILTS